MTFKLELVNFKKIMRLINKIKKNCYKNHLTKDLTINKTIASHQYHQMNILKYLNLICLKKFDKVSLIKTGIRHILLHFLIKINKPCFNYYLIKQFQMII